MTVEPTPALSREDAQRLTQRIQLIAGNAREAMEKLSLLVEQARSGRAHAALGFASWTDYLSSTLGASPMRLDRDQRRELVAYLAGEGMSTRAIAPIVGASKDTVHRDLATVSPETVDRPSMVTSLDGRGGVVMRASLTVLAVVSLFGIVGAILALGLMLQGIDE